MGLDDEDDDDDEDGNKMENARSAQIHLLCHSIFIPFSVIRHRTCKHAIRIS